MTELFAKLQEIREESSLNKKQDILKKYENDEEFRSMLKFLLDTSIVTGISEKKYYREITPANHGVQSETLLGVLEYLKSHNTGTDKDIATVRYIGYSLYGYERDNQEDNSFYKGIVTKNLPLGIDAKTVNKVWDNFIPTWDVMLAKKFFDKPSLVDGKRDFTITEKADGFRCIAIFEKNDGINPCVRLVSRQGKIYEGCTQIIGDIRKLPKSCVLDGEILIENRQRIESKLQYKETSKIVSSKNPDKRGICFNVFDYLEIDEFNSKKCATPYSERRKKLEETVGRANLSYVIVMPAIYTGNYTEKVYELLGKARERNEEGIMINFNDAPYEFKRTNNLLKVKVMSDMDLVITGFEEGENKYTGTLGAILAEYGEIKCRIGSGYSDEERLTIWNDRKNLVGRTVEVQYFEVTQNTTTMQKSLRFPVFKCIKETGVKPHNAD